MRTIICAAYNELKMIKKYKKTNVLIIGRQPLLADWLMADLEDLGVNCEYLYSTHEAKAFLKKYPADVVVSGHLLEDGNSIDLLITLKEVLKEAMPLFILWTGVFMKREDISYLFELGMVACFTKDNKQDLIEKVLELQQNLQ